MLIAIRVDASEDIGGGHVMRCLVLADALSALGAIVEFIVRDHNGRFYDVIKSKGYKIHLLPAVTTLQLCTNIKLVGDEKLLGLPQVMDADDTIKALYGLEVGWLIVDHYALDISWETKLRHKVDNIMVIDDVANRHHDCDILLDQTYGRHETDYKEYVKGSCKLLIGSSNALLRNDFSKLRQKALQRRKFSYKVNRILVSMGSMDELNITPRILKALSLFSWDESPIVDVVLTSSAPNLDIIKETLTNYKLLINLHIDVSNMAEIMLEADLAIGSGGTTSWERCCMALPTILIILAENQALIGKNLDSAGATITYCNDINLENNLQRALNNMIHDKDKYAEMSYRAAEICDGKGASKVAQEILK